MYGLINAFVTEVSVSFNDLNIRSKELIAKSDSLCLWGKMQTRRKAKMSSYKGFKVWVGRDHHRVFGKEAKQFSAWLRDAAFPVAHCRNVRGLERVSYID